MSSSERIMWIIEKLCDPTGYLTTAALTKRFEISERQARRDIAYIRDRIIPLSANHIYLSYDSYKHAYFLEGDVKDISELFARFVIAGAVAQSAMDPLRSVLGGERVTKESVRFISQAEEMTSYENFTSIMNAIDRNEALEISYRSKSRRSVRIIEPLELINYSAIWYVRSFDLDSHELRTFSLSRIIAIKQTGIKRTFSDMDMLKKYDDAGFGIFFTQNEPEEYKIQFKDDIAYIVSNQIWHKKQRGEWVDDSTYILTLPSQSDIELVSKVLGYGADAAPLSPKHFVDAYNREVKRLIESFGQ